jgi:hypothetical protein
MAGRSELYFIMLILLLGILLLIADRMLRIDYFFNKAREAPSRCGVGFQPCEHPLRCINGICAPTEIHSLKNTDLPVVP